MSDRDLDVADQVDAICDRFEANWRRGCKPSINQFLQEADVETRQAILHELTLTDMECRFAGGESPQVEQYLTRYPELYEDRPFVVELIHAERKFRLRRGESADLELYAQRFPEFAGLIAAHEETTLVPTVAAEVTCGEVRPICPHCREPIDVAAAGDEAVVCSACGSEFRMAAPTQCSGQPREIGRFRLLEFAGQGAAGSVYRAFDTQLDREVAIKIPRASWLPGGAEEERFMREARHAAQLTHPCIVPVYEIGRTDDFPYIVSEFVEGQTLADANARGDRFSFSETARLAMRIAEALQHAHAHGVIHRDLKPANVLLKRAQRDDRQEDVLPRIMDFGLARRTTGEETMTLEGQVIGTPAYMSPEQAGGHGFRADERADVYSVGVMLYELLTGEVPFRGNARMVLAQVLHEEPRPPRKLNDKIPRDLETICLKCMEKTAGNRYSSAGDLVAELNRFLTGQPIEARPIGRLERAWRWAQRNRTVASLGAAVAGALLIGAVVSFAFGVFARRQSQIAYEETQVALTATANETIARLAAERSQRNAQRYLYITRMIEAQQAERDGNIARVQELLSHYRSGDPFLLSLRGWEWFHLWRLCNEAQRTIWCDVRPIRTLAFSPDGALLVVGCSDGRILWHDVAGADRRRSVHELRRAVTQLRFSEDSKRLISADISGGLHLWDAQAASIIHPLAQPGTRPAIAAALAEGPRRRAVISTGVRINLVDFASDGSAPPTNGSPADPASRAGNQIDAQEIPSSESRQLAEYSTVADVLAISPDGQRVAVAAKDNRIEIFDGDTGEKTALIDNLEERIGALDFTSEGRLAAGVGRRIFIWEDGKLGPLQLPSSPSEVESVCWSPSGASLAIGRRDGSIHVVDLDNGQAVRVLRGHLAPVLAIAFSHDGRLASASGAGVVKIWKPFEQQVHGDQLGGAALDLSAAEPSKQGLCLAGRLATADDYDSISTLIRKGPDAIRTTYKTDPGLLTACLSSTGKHLAAGNQAGRVTLWQTGRSDARWSLETSPGDVTAMAFDQKDQLLAAAGSEGVIRVLNVSDGTVQQELVQLRPRGRQIRSLAFSHDGRRLAEGNVHGHVRIWDLQEGIPVHELSGHTGGVLSMAFSVNDSRLASTSVDATVKIWNLATGAAKTLTGHGGTVSAVNFDATGNRIAVGGFDRVLRVYDVSTGELVASMPNNPSAITAVLFSATGGELACACDDGTVLIRSAVGVDGWRPDRDFIDEHVRSLVAKRPTHVGACEELTAAVGLTSGDANAIKQRLEQRREDILAIRGLVARHVHVLGKSTTHYGKALKWVDAACQLEPRDPELLTIRTALHLHLNEIDLAAETAGMLLKIRPDSAAPLALQAIILHRLHRHADAHAALRRAESTQARTAEDHPAAKLYLGQAQRLLTAPSAL